jgi:hypothetical protein
MSKRFTEQEIQKIYELHDAGWTCRAIAAELGRSEGGVRGRLNPSYWETRLRWRGEHKDYDKQWYKLNREKKLEKVKAYRQTEHGSKINKAYRASKAGKEVQKRASAKWEAKNKDKRAEYRRKERLKRKAEKILLEIEKS